VSRTPRPTGPLPRRRVCLTNIGQLLTCAGPERGPLSTLQALGVVSDAELVVCLGLEGGWQVVWLGQRGAPGRPTADATFDLGGRTLMPGIVDCHTHLVFAGDRSHEFVQRLSGVSYHEIARQGGGIAHTVAQTRSATVPELVEAATVRLRSLCDQGARVVEIKTGYGLDLQSELKILDAVAALRARFAGNVELIATAMPAHAVPPECKADPEGYVDRVCGQLLPAMAAHAHPPAFVDVFVESGYFSVDHAKRIAQKARELGLGLKAHVDEFADIGGLPWAIGAGATSVEHLLQTSAEGIAALAASDTVAVGLPLTSVFLRAPLAPLRALVDAGARVALATDCNPGSSMTTSLTLLLQLAVLLGHLSPAEALRGVTRCAALAIGQPEGYTGRISVGEPFLGTVLDMPSVDAMFYHLGQPIRAWDGYCAPASDSARLRDDPVARLDENRSTSWI